MANFYLPPAISVKFGSINGSEKVVENKEWISNKYFASTGYPYKYCNLQFADNTILNLLEIIRFSHSFRDIF